MEFVDLNKGLTFKQLDELIGSRDHLSFLNTRNVLYRQLELKAKPPSRDEALLLMSENPNLIKRPVAVRGDSMVLGYSPDDLAALCDS